MRLNEASTAVLLEINAKFVQLVSKSKGVAVDVSSGDELGKEGFILYCARHYGELEGWKLEVNEAGQRVEAPAKVTSGKVWWEWDHPAKRVVRRIVMEPGVETAPDVYNAWEHLRLTMVAPDMSAAPEDIEPLIEHLTYLSDGDQEGVAYFLNWLAQLYKTPSIKLPSAIMLYSRHSGTGKSMLWELLSRVFGEPLVGMLAGKELHSKWLADIIGNKRLMVWNELSRTDKQDSYEAFKTFVSEKRQTFEGKGTKHKEVDCYCHNIITTNNADALPLMDGDRRILVLRCEAERKPSAYYREFLRWCREEGPALLAGVFAKWQFPEGWEPSAPVPQTRAVRQTQIESRSPLRAFLEELVEAGRAPFDRDFGIVSGLVEQLATAYPGNFRTLKINANSLGRALRDMGAVSERFNYYDKSGKRVTVRASVWRNQNDWSAETMKDWFERND